MKSLFKHSENISQAIISIAAFVVCGCVVMSRGGEVMWCGFCGCHFAVFVFDFLQEWPYRLPPWLWGRVIVEYGRAGVWLCCVESTRQTIFVIYCKPMGSA